MLQIQIICRLKASLIEKLEGWQQWSCFSPSTSTSARSMEQRNNLDTRFHPVHSRKLNSHGNENMESESNQLTFILKNVSNDKSERKNWRRIKILVCSICQFSSCHPDYISTSWQKKCIPEKAVALKVLFIPVQVLLYCLLWLRGHCSHAFLWSYVMLYNCLPRLGHAQIASSLVFVRN